MSIEYRISWTASSNHTFRGSTDWVEWDGGGETEEEIVAALNEGRFISQGLEEALDGAGFGWSVETRVQS